MNLTFDDVLIKLKWSNIKSREECDVRSFFSRNVPVNIPVSSANMRTVTDANMCITMADAGGIGILHRYFSSEEEHLKEIKIISDLMNSGINYDLKWGLSVGLDSFNFIDRLLENDLALPSVLVLDVANAENQHVFEVTKKLIASREYHRSLPNSYIYDIVIGNIATADAARKYKELDIDGLKVGIGPGSACTTRIMTGCGVPQLTAILDVAKVLKNSEIKIISDGGIKNAGDACKALGAGADCVMMGKVLAYAEESPGWKISGSYSTPSIFRKTYQGEASFREDRAHEGVKQLLELKSGETPRAVSSILEEYKDYIQSSMSYTNSRTMDQFQENCEFIQVSNNTLVENNPRN